MITKMKEIGQLIKTQDNRITDQPIFIVQRKIRDYGYDPAYVDDVVWIDEYNDYVEASPEEHEAMEIKYRDGDEIPNGWSRTGCRDRWEFVTACFTEQGCKDYLRLNGHNLGETRIYAAGSYRNEEFRTIRNFLLSL